MSTESRYEASGSGQSPAEGGIDLHALVQVINKRKLMILLIAAAVTSAVTIYTMQLPKRYRAVASMIIDPRPPQILGREVQEVVQLGSGGNWGSAEYYNTQMMVLRSKELAKRTIARLGLHTDTRLVPKSIIDRVADPDRLTDIAAHRLLAALRVRPPRENRVARIVIEHQDPELAAHLANEHVTTFIQYNLKLREQGTDDASKWLADRLDEQERKLNEAEQLANGYKQQNDMLTDDLENKQNEIQNSINHFVQAANEARAKRFELSALRQEIRRARKLDLFESPIFMLGESGTGSILKGQYYAEKAKLAEISTAFGPKNKIRQAQEQKVAGILNALSAEADLMVSTVNKRFETALQAEKRHEQQVKSLRAEAHDFNEKARGYRKLERVVKDNAEKVTLVKKRKQASDLSGRLTTVNVRELDAAVVPRYPSWPNLTANLGVALLLSLFGGIGLAFGLEYLDRSVKTASDVQAITGAPVLGVIPLVDTGDDDGRTRDMLVHNDPKSSAAECCRAIRTNLLFMAADKSFKSLVVSSPNPREGKTTSALYLGTTMAQGGQKILLIDTDMRRPRLHTPLGVGNSSGLSNLILGQGSFNDFIKTTEVPNLYLLPCGPTPPNPAELLMTDRFREILDTAEEQFDRVILDSPPLLPVTDAAVLSKRCDGVLFVMKAGSTLRDDAARAARSLTSVDARIIGVVLNELDLKKKNYGYYARYYSYGDPKDPQPTPT